MMNKHISRFKRTFYFISCDKIVGLYKALSRVCKSTCSAQCSNIHWIIHCNVYWYTYNMLRSTFTHIRICHLHSHKQYNELNTLRFIYLLPRQNNVFKMLNISHVVLCTCPLVVLDVNNTYRDKKQSQGIHPSPTE